MSQEEKIEALRALGVDEVKVLEFNPAFASMDTAAYLDYLRVNFDATTVVLGYDNRIGSDQLDPVRAAKVAESLGLEVEISPECHRADGLSISSTTIRTALQEGRVEDAASMLGYNYYLKGKVVGGKQLGRTIGFPTANMQLSESLKQLPLRGAYLTRVTTPKGRHYGMTNVGDIIETHIFDFDSDIYGSELQVEFLRRMRDEKKFSSVEELKSQLENDEKSAKKLIFEY